MLFFNVKAKAITRNFKSGGIMDRSANKNDVSEKRVDDYLKDYFDDLVKEAEKKSDQEYLSFIEKWTPDTGSLRSSLG